MKNFFNAIGVADMEKVHSAMIAWILDDRNDKTIQNNGSLFSTFSLSVRSEILCNLFGVNPKTFKSIQAFIEWNDIDVFIITMDNKEVEERWIIENKLKSQEHKSKIKINGTNKIVWQTEKYEIIANKQFCNTNNHYVLLSLKGDIAKSDMNRAPHLWKTLSYSGLGNLLSKYPNKASIVQEYVESIRELTVNLDYFLNYTSIFSIAVNSKVKKANKTVAFLNQIKDSHERYVIENGLESIFQQCLLNELYKKYTGVFSGCNYSIGVSSSGTAMLDILLNDIVDTQNNETYHVQFEFENGSFKVQVHQINDDGTMGNKGSFLDRWQDVFIRVAFNTGWTFNPPKEKSSRPFISLSLPKAHIISTWWKSNVGKLWNKNFQECNMVLSNLKTEYSNTNNVTLTP